MVDRFCAWINLHDSPVAYSGEEEVKILAVVQARLRSDRLPKKIIAKLGNSTVLEQIQRRVKASDVDVVLTAAPVADVEEIYAATGIAAFGGPEEDLLTRLLDAAKSVRADKMVRVTADCPLVDPSLIDRMLHYVDKAPIVTNTHPWRTFPNGMDLEIYDVGWLENLSENIPSDKLEYFYEWCTKNLATHAFFTVLNKASNLSMYRLTLDYPEDMEVIEAVYKAQGNEIWDTATIVGWLSTHSTVMMKNMKYNKETGSESERKAHDLHSRKDM